MFTSPVIVSNDYTDLTLDATMHAMQSLIIVGKMPVAKLAWWAAICSIQTPLERNMRYVTTLRAYAFKALPVNKDVLRGQLVGIMTSQLDALYTVESLSNDDIIHFNTGNTYESQSVWRRSMSGLIKGMGYKTVSFALHIYSPNTCKLLTVDVWHVRRIDGYKASLKCIRAKQYVDYEKQLIQDCMALQASEGNGNQYPIIVLAACLWERCRRSYGRTKPGSGYSEHDGLSCYM